MKYPAQIIKAMAGFILGSKLRLNPIMGKSSKWEQWVCRMSPTSCLRCRNLHGKIFDMSYKTARSIPAHFYCKCYIAIVDTIKAGTATISGLNGADFYLLYNNILPSYYITKQTAKKLGWKARLGNLSSVASGNQIGGDIYKNDDSHLPERYGRIWYEADINYVSGYRNTHRVLYSNDGLIFVTYDHYFTFHEIVY